MSFLEYVPAFVLFLGTLFVWNVYALRRHGWKMWDKGYDQGSADMAKANYDREERRRTLLRKRQYENCTCGKHKD